MTRWAIGIEPLFPGTSLGDCVPEDHPVRVFHDVLSSVDWSPWEHHYCRVAGQPAIPPMIVAGVILYGLSLGIRSSRRLEYACNNSVDFMWLAAAMIQGPGAGSAPFERKVFGGDKAPLS